MVSGDNVIIVVDSKGVKKREGGGKRGRVPRNCLIPRKADIEESILH